MTLHAHDGLLARRGGFWTFEKLTYLKKYADAFMTAMRPKPQWKRLEFIDLLCGPGIDIIDGKGEHPGSPLIALKTTPRFDKLHLGDLKLSNINALRKRIASVDEARVELRREDCHMRAETIVKEFPQYGTLALAFIDPEGFEVKFDLFRTFAARPIDILFLFPSGIGVQRNLERFARSNDDTLMDSLWGGHEWRALPVVTRLTGNYSAAEAGALDRSWATEFCKARRDPRVRVLRRIAAALQRDECPDVSLALLLEARGRTDNLAGYYEDSAGRTASPLVRARRAGLGRSG